MEDDIQKQKKIAKMQLYEKLSDRKIKRIKLKIKEFKPKIF